MPDEVALRKPETFDEANSVRIVLGDGRAWAFPKPWLVICPVFRGGVAGASYPSFAYDDRVEAMLTLVREAETLAVQVSAVASLAAMLLGWQYRLEDADLDRLLQFRSGDKSSADWMKAVMDVATGAKGPKASCAGSD